MTKKFEANDKNIQAFLKSAQMRAMVRAKTEAVKSRAGDGFVARVNEGQDRIRGSVSAATPEARRRQSRDHVIERAVGGG